jgi:phosphoribosyl 1,2-cyclic phosphate phosphodiesterase
VPKKPIKIKILGCGTSTGVPVIGCNCSVCKSKNPRNNRLRASLLISHNQQNIVIDTSADFRWQALRFDIRDVHAVLFTHHHADHVHGLNELRIYTVKNNYPIPCYGIKETLEHLKKTFFYIFDKETQAGGGLPQIELIEKKTPFNVSGLKIIPVEALHGKLVITGYRFSDFAYTTDCSYIPEGSKSLLRNLKLLIINALRKEPHPTHFNISEALQIIKELKPEQAVLTHLGHNIDYDVVQKELPDNVFLAYDGMEFNFN